MVPRNQYFDWVGFALKFRELDVDFKHDIVV